MLRSTPASSSATGSRAGRVAGGVEGGQDPLCAAAVAQHDPGPAEPVGDVEREPRVVRDAPRQGGVDVGAFGAGEGKVLGLAGCVRPSSTPRRPRRTSGRASAERVFEPRVGHRLEREGPDAVQQPVASPPSAPGSS